LDKIAKEIRQKEKTMNQRASEATPGRGSTTVERTSDQEVVVSRTFNAPARAVFEAWTRPELFRQWWVPKSFGMTLLSCEMDVRTGGTYRLEFAHPASAQPMAFFGRYIDVVANARIVWTNEESEEGAVTTVTFEEKGGKTMLVKRDRYPSKEALDGEIGATDAMRETLDQLEEFIVTLAKP
jgi:uncharacterized protein YndB with AHSA1/START domain